MAKLNLDLVSEMTWSECIRNAADSDLSTKSLSVWICDDCRDQLTLPSTRDMLGDAQAYLDKGWGYRRAFSPDRFVARCKACRPRRKLK